MIDMSIPVVLGTVVAEVIVVVSAFSFSDFLNNSDQPKIDTSSRMKVRAQGWEDATHGRRPSKKMSYKDETESYFDA